MAKVNQTTGERCHLRGTRRARRPRSDDAQLPQVGGHADRPPL